jgi:hypothetical protein
MFPPRSPKYDWEIIMKRIAVALIISLAVVFLRSTAQEIQRLPLQKNRIELKSPSSWSQRIAKIDPRTQKAVHYDPKPKIETVNSKAGKYYLKWIGYDGKEKVVLYQRPDCIDVVVVASTTTASLETYTYEYTVQNLATSGDYLNGFAVQNFSSAIQPKRPSMVNNIVVGDMTPGIFGIKEGNWIRFAPVPPHPKVQHGQSIRFKLYSSSPPGVVMCRVDGGNRTLKGVGEEMPEELEESLDALGYGAWPRGYTIGPVDKLKNASREERIAYLLKTLPTIQKQRWITPQVLSAYEQLLKQNDLPSLSKRVAGDFKTGAITSEVFAIIEAMKS